MIFSTYHQKRPSKYLHHSGDLEYARARYLDKEPLNLYFLLRSRFQWMNKFIEKNSVGVELGSGIGASKDFIIAENFKTSDFTNSEWIDLPNINALATPFKDASQDFIIASNMIHHCAYPIIFLEEIYRILKPGGVLLIQEVETSFMMRLILKLMQHEGFDENINVFDRTVACNDPLDLWSANCSIPKLLFKKADFEHNLSNWRVLLDRKCEFFTFLNSGGVYAKTRYIPITFSLFTCLNKFDSVLIKLFPGIFPLQRRIVLQKKL
jgi:SAM-dependent methyltransferase